MLGAYANAERTAILRFLEQDENCSFDLLCVRRLQTAEPPEETVCLS